MLVLVLLLALWPTPETVTPLEYNNREVVYCWDEPERCEA